jgi:hypothetical protein
MASVSSIDKAKGIVSEGNIPKFGFNLLLFLSSRTMITLEDDLTRSF